MSEQVESTKKRSLFPKNTKKIGCFTLIFIALFTLCGGTIGILWAGGWIQDTTCSVVLEDSYIYEKMHCSNTTTQDETESSSGGTIDIKLPEGIDTTEELVTSIIDQTSPAVVTVAVNRLAFDMNQGYVDQQSGIGSGFIVDSDGLIVTNQHVVSDENEEYSIFLPGENEAIPVENVYRDNVNDLAVLKINKSGLKSLKLGDSEKLRRGNLVIAIGNPFGDLAGTATVGYVTGLDRDVSAGSGFFGSVTHYEGVIQTDAAINPGNSGGPLINSQGEVIGVNFATTQGADNISFAIPINRVKTQLDVFKKEGRFPQPYIGISYSQRTVILNNRVVTGAVVLSVESGGPADKGGVERGDIIMKMDGKDLSEYSLQTIIQGTKVGSTVELQVFRDGDTVKLKVIIGDKGE
jgi:serine protease Do